MFDIPLDPTQGVALLLFALIAPLLISFVKQAGFTKQQNALVALVCYIAFGILGAIFSGIELNAQNLVPIIIVITLTGRAAYSMFWSLIGGDAEGNGSIDDRITAATSLKK